MKQNPDAPQMRGQVGHIAPVQDHASTGTKPWRQIAVLTVMGPSGVGKSTLLAYVTGNLAPGFRASG
ncbi:MAG: hypothetical protein AAFQ64_21540, partial [Pseudomonadota bacterium]